MEAWATKIETPNKGVAHERQARSSVRARLRELTAKSDITYVTALNSQHGKPFLWADCLLELRDVLDLAHWMTTYPNEDWQDS